MPLYRAKCPVHGDQDIYIAIEDEETRELLNSHRMECRVETSPPCFERLKRVWGFSMPPVMQEHWNFAVNGPISDMGQFRDKLKRISEEQEARTGIPTTYEPMDWDDPRIAPKETDQFGRSIERAAEIEAAEKVEIHEAVAAEVAKAEGIGIG